MWARDLALGKLISPARKREQQQFLAAPEEGDGALYGLALESQNGWLGHNGNTMSSMAYPYYLPSERLTMVVLLNSGADIPGSWMMIQDITRIISPHNPWPGLPKEARQPAGSSRTNGSAQRDPLPPGHRATAQAATARPMP